MQNAASILLMRKNVVLRRKFSSLRAIARKRSSSEPIHASKFEDVVSDLRIERQMKISL